MATYRETAITLRHTLVELVESLQGEKTRLSVRARRAIDDAEWTLNLFPAYKGGRGRKKGARIEKPCQVCGKVMVLIPSQAHRKTCSYACRDGHPDKPRGIDYTDAIRRYRLGDPVKEIAEDTGVSRARIYSVLKEMEVPRERPKVGKQKVPRTPITCAYCGKTFELLPSQAKNRVYCSQECANEGRERSDADEIVARYLAGEKVRRIMAIHGTQFTTIYRMLERRGILPDRPQGRPGKRGSRNQRDQEMRN